MDTPSPQNANEQLPGPAKSGHFTTPDVTCTFLNLCPRIHINASLILPNYCNRHMPFGFFLRSLSARLTTR